MYIAISCSLCFSNTGILNYKGGYGMEHLEIISCVIQAGNTQVFSYALHYFPVYITVQANDKFVAHMCSHAGHASVYMHTCVHACGLIVCT